MNEQYKITVYYKDDFGEIFDLKNDPAEINNLWDDPAYLELKQKLMLKMLQAELGMEPVPMPRVAPA